LDCDPIALALLGINKLFEGALTNVGRMIAFDQGWYAHRRVFQVWLVASVLAICSIGAIVLLLSARQASLSTRLALSATIMMTVSGIGKAIVSDERFVRRVGFAKSRLALRSAARIFLERLSISRKCAPAGT
jgi:hypothetical protein